MRINKTKTSVKQPINELDNGRFSILGDFDSSEEIGFCHAFDNQEQEKVTLFYINISQTEYQEDILRAFKKSGKQSFKNHISFYTGFATKTAVFGVNAQIGWQSLNSISNNSNFDIYKFCLVFHQLSLILLALHNKNIIHGMIRLETIFINQDNNCAILPTVGPPIWQKNKPVYYHNNLTNTELSKADDIYAFGVTMLAAWLNKNTDFEKIKFENEKLNQEIIQNLTPEWLSELLERILFSLPEARIFDVAQISQSLVSRQSPAILSVSDLQANILANQTLKLIQKQKWNKAITLAEFGLAKHESAHLQLALGQAYLSIGQVEKALDYLKKSSEKLPYLTAIPLSQAYMYVDKFSSALTLLTGIAIQDPQNIIVVNQILQCYFKTQRAGTALDLIKIYSDQELNYYSNNYFVLSFADGQNIEISELLVSDSLFCYNIRVASYLRKNKLSLLAHKYMILEDLDTISKQINGNIQIKNKEKWSIYNQKIVLFGDNTFLNSFDAFVQIVISGIHAVLLNYKFYGLLVVANNTHNWTIDGQKIHSVCRLTGLHTFSNPITNEVFIINIGLHKENMNV